MNSRNAWANPTSAGGGDAIQMAAFLEERSQAPDMKKINQVFCGIVAARPGERLLEVGSGSGILSRLLATALQPGGSIAAVDISPEMTVEAKRFSSVEGCRSGIAFLNGAAESLPFQQASFDATIAARLLLHVPDPKTVIFEMKRVVKPGGRLVVMDWDFDTVTVDHPNRELTRRLLHWRCDHHGGNNWSGRQLWRLMKSADLRDCTLHPQVSIVHAEADGLTQSLWRAAQVAVAAEAISPLEQQTWIDDLKHDLEEGTFCASIVYFIVEGYV